MAIRRQVCVRRDERRSREVYRHDHIDRRISDQKGNNADERLPRRAPFFTDLYGHTRWEAWYPTGPANTTTNCSGPTQMEYQGVTFYRQDCHDWSAVTLYPTPQPYLPWPYPETNVLVNSHFDGLQGWQYGSGLDVSVVPSTTALDTAFSQNGHGVDYLQVNCAGQCWPSQAVFQDVPISAVQAGQQVDYGFSGVVQASAGANMLVTLSIQDAQGAQLWSTSFDATVPTNSQGSSRPPRSTAQVPSFW